MTAEYLDRSSLVARMEYYEKHTTEESGEHYAYSVALREIRNAPAADVVEVVHAKWIPARTAGHAWTAGWRTQTMGDFEQMLNDLCKMSKAQLVQMVRNTDEVEIALNIFKNVMKEDYAMAVAVTYFDKYVRGIQL